MKKKENKIRQYIYCLLICLQLVACNNVEHTQRQFVSTKNPYDTLQLNDDGSYIRKLKVNNEDGLIIDKGTWYYAQDRIWLNNWVHRGEDTFSPFGKKVSSISFSFDKDILGHVKTIYFDIDNYYYYKGQ